MLLRNLDNIVTKRIGIVFLFVTTVLGIVNAQVKDTDVTPNAEYPSAPSVSKSKKRVAAVTAPEYVDLGLSVKWGACNLGALTPETYGNYYAWGEVDGYEFSDGHCFTESACRLYGKSATELASLLGNSTGCISGNSNYDAATYNLGPDWRMPTESEILELLSCSHTWTTNNGVYGMYVTGSNGNSIFLPAGGRIQASASRDDSGELCEYSSGTPRTDNSGYAVGIYGSSSEWCTYEARSSTGWGIFNLGRLIRPVYVGTSTPTPAPSIKDAFTIPSGATLSISNSTTYPWVNNSGTLTPGNSGVQSSDSYFTATISCDKNITLTFDWYVSSESGCDYLYYYVDGGTKTQISGSTSVASQSIYLSAGTHTVTFGYKKDGSVNNGSDKGYISNIKIQKEAVLPPGVVDLGLPSGTKWATCNLGATSPEGYGKYYAWGEVQGYHASEGHDFSSSNCRLYGSSSKESICGNPSYDAATYELGASWRLANDEEIQEILNCSHVYTTQNGVSGWLITGPNGNTMFWPATGNYSGTSKSSDSWYWSGIPRSSNNTHGDGIYANGSSFQWLAGCGERYCGGSIRPVYVGPSDYLIINDTICSQGTTVNLPVNLTNSSSITEIGFVVELPEGITLEKNASNKYYVNFTERGETHTCTARDVADGVKMAIVNMEGDAFTGNEGTIFTLPLEISSTMPNGNYTIRLKSVELSDGNLYELEDVTATITVTANRVTAQNVEGYAGTTAQFPVDLINRDAITEVGFVVTLPAGITLDKNASNQYYVNFTDRAEEHTATGRDVANGVKFAVLNMSGDAFTGNDGTILNLPLQISSTLAEGLYPVRLSEIQLSDGNLYEIGDVEAYINVHRFIKGDVNNDGRIAVNDISLTIQAYLGNASADFVEYAGDMNDNSRIDVADISGVVSAYLSASGGASRVAAKSKSLSRAEDADNLTVADNSVNAGEVFELEIGLDNMKAYTEVGGYISLPEGFKFVTKSNGKYDITLNRDRVPGHSISTKLQDNGDLKFALVNMDGDPVEDNSGTIMTVKVMVDETVVSGDYEVMLYEIQLSDGDLYEPGNVSANITVHSDVTGIQGAESVFDDHSIYNVNGMKLNGIIKNGLYIIDGKKVVVKDNKR